MKLGERMKLYEHRYRHTLLPHCPALARLDGRAFHALTQGLDRPFDHRLANAMMQTAAQLAKETHARAAYTQSDEISLLWKAPDINSGVFFGGMIQKMASTLAALGSVIFNEQLRVWLPELLEKRPTLDCRVWDVPTDREAVSYFIWRERDAVKNSISMAAGEYYSHQELLHKNSSQKQELLWQKGVNWNNYPAHFKRGTYYVRRRFWKTYTPEEIEKLPPKHDARQNPECRTIRSTYVPGNPILTQLADPRGFLFEGTFGEKPVRPGSFPIAYSMSATKENPDGCESESEVAAAGVDVAGVPAGDPDVAPGA